MAVSFWNQEGSMDSLYEAVQSSSDGPAQPVPSCSCSPAVLLDDNTKWRGSGRSISMVDNYEGWKLNPDWLSSNHADQNVYAPRVVPESKPTTKRNQKTGKKPGGKSCKEGMKKSHNSTVHSQFGTLSPPMGAHYLDIPYRSDRRPYLDKASTLPAQENATPGRCMDTVTLPGGATPTHSYHQHWSNPSDSSPAWGTIQHICRRPLTEYRMYSHDFITPHAEDHDGRQQQATAHDDSSKRDCKTQISVRVHWSNTDVDLSESNVSFC
ncbi:hypothetical protein LDENG_00100260 [Lucifuga dentata]|nr:hypothetical protein LDENG_00100260 [Lucifuga dentata]